tara:strand:- start:340 stop:489 length:150 start_codon:yes stop_codon:yes gene_type:complete
MENTSVELLIEILDKRDEAKKYMEQYKKLMEECDKSIEKLRKHTGWEVE